MIVDLWTGDAELGDIVKHVGPDDQAVWDYGIDAIYTDPPWNEGIGKIFRRWADKTGEEFSLSNLAARTVEQLYCICPAGPWFLEVGPHPDLWREAVSGVRQDVVVRRTTWGEGKKPSHVIQAGAPLMPEGLHGEESTEWVFNYFIDRGVESVCDPFVGKGLTVRYALPLGISIYGMELNPKRLAVAQRKADELMEGML